MDTVPEAESVTKEDSSIIFGKIKDIHPDTSNTNGNSAFPTMFRFNSKGDKNMSQFKTLLLPLYVA